MFVVPAFTAALVTIAAAVEIRSFDPDRHNLFSDFPAAPKWNDAAYVPAREFSGVGWSAQFPIRKATLVSPRHVLMATHAMLPLGGKVRFLNREGELIERGLREVRIIGNGVGGNSDLTLGILDFLVEDDSGVGRLPYLNLADESAYLGTELLVFGNPARVGRGEVHGFEDLVEPRIQKTRSMNFRYFTAAGNPDDAHVVAGDSGAPSLVYRDGLLSLVGTHSSIAVSSERIDQYDIFIPHYAATVDMEMAAAGFVMRRAEPERTTLETSAEWLEPLREGRKAKAVFIIRNTGSYAIRNLQLDLNGETPPEATESTAPWASGEPSSGLRRYLGMVAPGAETKLEISWPRLPFASELSFVTNLSADGADSLATVHSPSLLPSFASFSRNLSDSSTDGDDDQDGIGNLLEYAFGGDPAVSSARDVEDRGLLPQLVYHQNSLILRYLRRNDAALRALTYIVESSADLDASGWAPVEAIDLPPPVPGPLAGAISLVEMELPPVVGHRFYRVRIELTE